jgi:RsiW-degrading membrane proteinase PrsW (M82 family)
MQIDDKSKAILKVLLIYVVVVFLMSFIKTPLIQTRAYDIYFFSLLAVYTPFIMIFYLRMIDIYEKEKWYQLFSCFIIGIIAFHLLDLRDRLYFLFYENSFNPFHLDHLYESFLFISLVEELVKITPLIILVIFNKFIDEPVDYIIYGCVGALAFSFCENFIYFNSFPMHPSIIANRSFQTTFVHLISSSIVSYSLYLLIKGKKYLPPLFILFALIYHTGYNCLTKINADLALILVTVFGLVIFQTIIFNSLKKSPFFDSTIKLKTDEVYIFLFYALTSLFIIEFIVLTFKFGFEISSEISLSSIKNNLIFLVFIILNLSNKIELKGRSSQKGLTL